MRKKQKVLWKLFLSTLYLSAFTFGGGYVIVTLMKDKFVDKYHWIEENEMLDLIAIAQSAPGAIAVNGAIVVGYKLAGLAGVLTAIFGTVLPPFLIISVISVFYQMFCDNFIISQLLDGMQAGVGAVIASVVWDMAAGITKKKEWTSIVIMAVAFIASYVMEVPVVYIVLICIAMGVIRTVLAGRGDGRNDLSSVIFQFPSDRHVQLRRRLCRDAVNSGTGGEPSRMAGHGRIHQSDHHFSDDTGSHRDQFRNFCRNQDCRNPGSSGFHVRMHPAIVYSGNTACLAVPEISENGSVAECLTVSATGGCGDDRVCGRIDSGICLLERGGCHRTGGHPLGDGGNLCDLPDPSSENKMEPGTCNGVGRSAEAADGDCGDRIKGFSFPENCGILEHRKHKGEHIWNFG